MLWEGARRRGPVAAWLQQPSFFRQHGSCFRQGLFLCDWYFVCNNGDAFVVFYLSVVFQFINSNNRGSLLNFHIDFLSVGSQSWLCFGPAKIISMRS